MVNVIRGEQLPDAVFNVRTPILRIPLWMAVVWWLVKGLVRTVVLYMRFWYATVPASVLLYLWARFGWAGPVTLVGGLACLAGVWLLVHRVSFLRFGWYPVLGRWRRIGYRRRWYPAMATARLVVNFDGHVVVPVLRRVKATASGDELTVRMVTGQIPDDFAAVGLRLTHTFGARSCRVAAGRRADLVVLTLQRADALRKTIPPAPVPVVPDLAGLVLGRLEGGEPLRLRLFGTQILVAGATGAGKGSVIWSVIAALAGGVRSGLVKLWVFDPKGGMEMAAGDPLFERFACEDFAAMADALETAVGLMRERTRRLRGVTRQHIPTVDEPLVVIVVDELAALTAYLTDRHLKDRIKAALGVLLTQGRAAGVHVVAAVQDSRKDVLPFRDLFPTRIALRLTEPAQVDMVLGDGMRDRGAVCDRIPMNMPGVGYLVLDGDPSPVRVRFSYWDDDRIAELAGTYSGARVIDGQVITGEVL
ncbi:FtsK/SpoIIIE domain-containing protein [Rugosimonospora africana]|nr:FtsK/SpoIIIE domain-containing protein [Rugosimonospora africana]